ncbi:unnamed protein product [Nezara viridula]|uniref:Uncharacterized protein n=1 Tax=Nezara viridula TaxID=85310 RepID=A0A9P0MMU8_NEZVI|nr:unnamed protein product [Nezara viridula]
MCLWCNTSGKKFYSMDAAQAYMRDKGHCKVFHVGHTLIYFEFFYNYSKSHPDYVKGMDKDEEINIFELDSEDLTLTLSSGATIVHRTLFTYYKQHYGNKDTVVAKRNKISKVLSTYRALGWKETEKEIAVRKAKDIRYMRAVQSKMAMRLGVKTNKLQKHFRPQVNF